jgi:hypothetical protein
MKDSPNRRDLSSVDSKVACNRIQGGNWRNTHGFRRASELHDEVECQLSIAEYILEQGLPRDGEFS